MRIEKHPILGEPNKGRLVNFEFDGKAFEGYEGEPIAAALRAAGVLVHRHTKKKDHQEAYSVLSVDVQTA